jgi:hypothetical protein
MTLYKISNTDNISSFANRKSASILKIIVFVILFIIVFSIFQRGKTDTIMPFIATFTFILVLFFIMFKAVKKLMWFLGKNIIYMVNDNTLVIQQAIENINKMPFLVRFFYYQGKRKGAYKDVSIDLNKVKSIKKNNSGDLIVKTKSFNIGKITIPREIDNLRALENQLREQTKLKQQNIIY